MTKRPTTALEKLLASIITVMVVVFVALPFKLQESYAQWRWVLICVMLLYNLIFSLRRDRRDLGMLIVGSYWEKEYPLWKYLVFTLLYTLSFCSLLFWIVFPGDLLLINLLIIQLPTIYLTKTTLHGWLSGDMRTVKIT